MASLVPQNYYDQMLAQYGFGPLTRGTQAGFMPGGYRGDGTEVRGRGVGESREYKTPMTHPGEFAFDVATAPAQLATDLMRKLAEGTVRAGDTLVETGANPRDPRTAAAAFDVAGAAMTGGLGLGIAGRQMPANALGIFGGRLAKTADQSALARAKEMAAKGALREQMSAPAQPKGITAYHGSPHDFDRFDMSRIGTGEGAQAYGHGLYFAESPEVADTYRKTIGPIDFATAAEAHAYVDAVAKALATGKPVPEPPGPRRGRMYEVRINAEPDDFLEWGLPAKEQSAAVRAKLPPEWQNDLVPEYPTWMGYAGTPEGAAKLREAGILGTKYLDQGSRAAGEGSRNYVVFDDKIIDIVRKYGIAAAIGMFGWDAVNKAGGGQQAPFGAPTY